jgi:acyl-CoA synthetase (NDP forming)
MAAGFHPDVKKKLDAGGVPYLQGTRATLRAIESFLTYGEFQGARKKKGETTQVRPVEVDLDGWRKRLQDRTGELTEVEVRELLAAYGMPGPWERACASEEDAVVAAREIGYPVVLKVLSQDIQHKTEIGGVRVGLGDEDAVREAFRQITAAALSQQPEAQVQGVLVQEMVTSGIAEVILAVMRDPDFGPIVVYGSGGVLVELLQDSSLRQPPIGCDDALAMIEETRGATLLRGFRGAPPADVAALADALVRLSWLAADLGNLLTALEINPLIVRPAGQGVVAVDALLERD